MRKVMLVIWRALPKALFVAITTAGGFAAWLNEPKFRAWVLEMIRQIDFVRTALLLVLLTVIYLVILWRLSREPRTGREEHQGQLHDIAQQHSRAQAFLDGIVRDEDWQPARDRIDAMLGQSESWIETNIGAIALAKYKSEGGRLVYPWHGDHDIVIRAARMAMLGTLHYRIANLDQMIRCPDWDSDPPLGKRKKPPAAGPWQDALWLPS